MLEVLPQLIVSGILLGGIYGVSAIGLSLIYGVLRVVNFAHGEFLMLAMFGTFWLHEFIGMDPYLSILVVGPLLFLVGVVTERFLIRPTLGRPHLVQVFVTFGLAFALQNAALMAWGANFRSVRLGYTSTTFNVLGVSVPIVRLISFVVAMVVAVALYYFVRRTYFGKAIRATAEDRTAAALMGIDINRVYLVTFGIGSALVGIAGAVMMPIFYVYPSIGFYFALIAYVVIVLGGLGSIKGAIIGGIVIGLIEAISGFYLGTSLKQIVYFTLFVVILIIKPAGLFGQRGAEELGYE